MPNEKRADNGLKITFHGERFNPGSPKYRQRLDDMLANIRELECRAEMPSPDRMAVRASDLNLT